MSQRRHPPAQGAPQHHANSRSQNHLQRSPQRNQHLIQRLFQHTSPYRPAQPSPLSQRPLQASLSSSRTVNSSQSVASSTRTASTSATSRFSITQAFSSLRSHEVAFFDQVISLLPPNAADFSQLKKAYNVVLSSEIDSRNRAGAGAGAGTDPADSEAEWDTNLWSCLLSLVKVRGADWSERWDSVRLALGLEPRSGSSSDDGGARDAQSHDDVDASADDSNNTSDEHFAGFERQHGPPRPSVQPSDSRRAGFWAASSSSEAGQKRKTTVPHRRDEARGWTGNEAAMSPDSFAGRGRRQGQDESAAGPSRLRARANSYEQPHNHRKPRSSSLERIERRRLLQLGANAVPNLGVLESTREQLQRLRLQDRADMVEESRIDTSMSDPEDFARPSHAQKRFQEVVRNSQAEREALRRARAQQQEAAEERQWAEEAMRADRVFAHRLLRTCLGWWLTLARREAERARNAQQAHARILMARSWDRWKDAARHELVELSRAEQIDQVRCKLGAWRRWRRICQETRAARHEAKKEALKNAYYHISGQQKARISGQAYHAWRDVYLERVADAIRRRHLQQGAFAIWQLRLERLSHLRLQEVEMTQRCRFRLLETHWALWSRRTLLAVRETHIVTAIDTHLAQDAFALWRKKTMLDELAEAFVRRRLQTAALTGWLEAREVATQRNKKEALADRWRNRRMKRSALQHWTHRLSSIRALDAKATQVSAQMDGRKMANALTVWVARERGALLIRVRQARLLEECFGQWKERFFALRITLSQMETTLLARRRQNTLTVALDLWREKTSSVVAMQRLAVATDTARIRFVSLGVWRQKLEAHALEVERSETAQRMMLQRRAFRMWTVRLRESRSKSLLADRDRGLLADAFSSWEQRLAQHRHDNAKVKHLSNARNRSITQTALQRWLHLTIERRNAELNATLYHRLKQQQAVFYHWVSLCLKHDDMLNLVQSHLDLKREAQLGRLFSTWLTRARQAKDRKERLESWSASRRRTALAASFDAWRSRYIESTLQEVEYEVTLKHHEVTILRLLRVWAGRTAALPAIRMRNANLKRLALTKWQRALPNQLRQRTAEEIDSSKLLGEVVERWKAKWKERRRIRAAERFGTVGVARLRRRSGGAGGSAGSLRNAATSRGGTTDRQGEHANTDAAAAATSGRSRPRSPFPPSSDSGMIEDLASAVVRAPRAGSPRKTPLATAATGMANVREESSRAPRSPVPSSQTLLINRFRRLSSPAPSATSSPRACSPR